MGVTGIWKTALAVILFLGIIIAFFFMSQSLLVTPSVLVDEPGDAETIDFSSEIALLHNDAYDWYGGKLYTPEDFAAGVPKPEPSDLRYGTNRLVLRLPAHKLYGISGTSASYAQRVWVNGVLLSEIGEVTDTAEGFVPKTTLYSVYFTADTPETEIVIQRAHHNHVRGYYVKLYLGDAEIIAQMDKDWFMREGLITGALSAIGIFFIGMFLFYPNRRGFLWFALACFSTTIQNAIYSKSVMTVFPDLNWYLGHKIEYIALIAYFFFVFLFAFSMLEWKSGKWLHAAAYVFFIGSMAVYAIFPSTVYTHYTATMRQLLTVYIVFGAIWLSVTVIRKKELRKPEQLMTVASMLMMAAAWWIEQRGYMGDMVIAVPLATLLFAFIGAISLTTNFSRTERQLDLARQKEREISETNAALERINTLKSDFTRNISHEMKTPLTVMSGYAQLTSWQLEESATNDETMRNLKTISSEAQRLADMVTKLLALSFGDEAPAKKTKIEADALLADAAAVCRPILQKKDNALLIDCAECPPALGNYEMLLQVLINLAINAGKHTEQGVVTFSAKEDEADDGLVIFRVADTGDGISPEDAQRVFEKGFSRDDGNGLGLSISREVVEAGGGTIEIERTGGDGTTISFTVPRWREE